MWSLRTPPQTPKTLETCKKKHGLFDSESFKACGRSHVYNNSVPYLSFSVKYQDLTRKSCVFICYFIDSMVKIVFSEAATGGVLYKKVFLKFKKFTGKHKARISFLINLQAPLTSLLIILTWKSLNILYRKLMKFF